MPCFGAKQDARRVSVGHKNPGCIHRARTALQKQMGVRIARVDIVTRAAHIVPDCNVVVLKTVILRVFWWNYDNLVTG